MAVSDRASKISSVIAALCIVIYIAAISYGAIQVIVNMGERRDKAEREFQDLSDRASSAVFLGFMSEPYQEAIRDFLAGSDTLLGIIITGSSGENAFERYPGSGITWVGNSPRFKTGFGYPSLPPYMNLLVEGQRNVTIQAIYSYIDNDDFLNVLKNTLLAILASLAIAFITLLFELAGKTKSSMRKYSSNEDPGRPESAYRETASNSTAAIKTEPAPSAIKLKQEDDFNMISILEDSSPIEELPADPFPDLDIPSPEMYSIEDENDDGNPQGLYTPRSNVGWESYTLDRLASETHRCASFEQDLVFLVMEFNLRKEINDSIHRQIADEVVGFFSMRDLIFEKGEKGFSIIIPNTDLDQSLVKAEEFKNLVNTKLSETLEGPARLSIGLSSRSGRLVEAERLMMEAFSALDKAKSNSDSPIIAFKSDPEKYRNFVKGHLNS